MRVGLFWFRNDLRIDDHPGLCDAVETCDELLPLVIAPERWRGRSGFGFQRTGPFRAQFWLESVRDLRSSIEELGSVLHVRVGNPSMIIAELSLSAGVTDIWYQDEPGTEEADEAAAVDAFARANGIPVHRFTLQTLYHPDDAPFTPGEMPDIYTDFRKALEKGASVRPAASPPSRLPPPPVSISDLGDGASALPSAIDLSGSEPPVRDQRAVLQFRGGEHAAGERMTAWIWERDRLRRYKQTRNGLLGADYSSKLSPWLANGSLSPRRVHAEVRRYEALRTRNQSTYWLIFELIWRDYFWFLLRKYGRRFFLIDGPMQRRFDWSRDREAFDRWREGRTGERFIDANMRELAASGYMSNRGRQNVASYLARDMKIDWRMGAEWFEYLLLDYDPASNWGNWNYNTGVGTDPRLDRYFDPVRQAEKYDAQGRYRDHWL